MLRNNNSNIIKKLSNRSFKVSKTRNIILIIAIILTTVLFTSLFTVGYSMFEAFSNYQMLEYGTSSHAQLQDISDKQINIIEKDSTIDNSSIGIVKYIGSLNDAVFSTQTVNISVYDEISFKNSVNMDMVEGNLPTNKNEIVMPVEVLDMLELPYEIGTEITLNIPNMENSVISKDSKKFKFKLSGFYKYRTATVIPIHEIFASESFYDEYAKRNEVGPRNIYFNFIDDKDLENQYNRLLNKIKPYSGKGTLNTVYLNTQTTSIKDIISNLLPIVVMILIIMISGYLLIYNIFYISVVKDIRYYGLLKTIGTSPKQIKKLITNQANNLCMISIPIGLFIGYILGIIFVPMVGRFFDGLNMISFNYFNPLVFIFAFIFSYITVRLSCYKPAKIACNMSSIDSINYVEQNINNKSKKGNNGTKIYNMVISNVFRNKKKSFLVILSMSLSCIIFMVISTIIISSNPKNSAQGIMIGDVEIHHGLAQFASYEEDIEPISNQMIKEIENLKGIRDIQRIYADSGRVLARGSLVDEILTQEIDKDTKEVILFGKNPKEFIKTYNALPIDLRGISSAKLLEEMIDMDMVNFYGKSKIIDGSINKEKFNKGGYAIIAGNENSKIKVGDKINLEYINQKVDTSNDLEVMAIIDGGKNFNIDLYIHENDFKKIVKVPSISKLFIDIDKDMEQIEGNITKLNQKYNNPYTKIYSKTTYIEEAKYTQRMITIIGMSVVLIIGLIGVLNLINTMISNIIIRIQEFALLEAIGMTKKQIKKMLVLEGLFYSLIINIINLVLGSLATILGFNIMKLRYSVYTYPKEALLTCIFVVFCICLVVPLIVYKNCLKGSVVENIRSID